MEVKFKCSNVTRNNLEYSFKNLNSKDPDLKNRCKAAFKGKFIVANMFVTKKKGKIYKLSIHFKIVNWGGGRNDILKDKNNKENKTPQRKQNMEIDQN